MITVAHVLGLPGLGLEAVVEGDTGAAVSWVATSELADPTPYLEGGEIVLFTGIDSAVRRRSWPDYARRLAGRGVVALGMGVGEHLSYTGVPDPLAQACREAGLTLFRVPERTPFLGIIRAVADMRAAQERTDLEAMLSMQRALTRAAVGADGPALVLRSLASQLEGSWVAVCTADAEVVRQSGPPVAVLPSDRTLGELVGRLRSARLRGSLSESGPRGSIAIHPLGVQGTPQSYLVVVLPRPFERLEVAVITTAVALLSLHAERAVEQALFRRRIRAGALSLLLSGDVRSADALLAVAGTGSWSATARRVRVVRLRGGTDQLQEGIRRIEAYVDRTSRPVLAGTPTAEASGEESAAVLLEDLPDQLAELRGVVELSGLRAGIGGAADVHDARTSAREALEALERTSARHRIGAWEDAVAGGIAGLLPPGTGRIYAQELLRPVREREDGGERLLPVLRTFLTHNGNRRQTAAELGIHRNTLLQRLQSIEQALGRSLEDPQVRAELWIALQLAGT